MPVLYSFFADGGFIVGNLETGVAAYAHADSEQGFEASTSPEAAIEIARWMADEMERRGGFSINNHSEQQGSYPKEQAGCLDWLNEGLADGSTKTLPEPSRLNLIEYPSGRFGFVGRVPPELAFSSTHEGDIANAVASGPDMARRIAEGQGRTFGLLSWPTAEAAQEAARMAGYQTIYAPMSGRTEAVEQAQEPRPMTLQEAKAEVAGLGYTIVRTGQGDELRVAPKDGTPASQEERAYYTDDLADAVGTVKAELQCKQQAEAARDPMADLMRALGPDVAQLGEGIGGQVIDWPEQPDTYHGQRDQRAEEGRPIEPAARLLEALRAGMGEQGATVTNHASQERGGLEPGDRVFLAPRSAERERW